MFANVLERHSKILWIGDIMIDLRVQLLSKSQASTMTFIRIRQGYIFAYQTKICEDK